MNTLLIAFFCLLGATSAFFLPNGNTNSAQVKTFPGQCPASDQTTTKTCLDAYFKTYGFDTSKGLPDYLTYSAETIAVVKKYGVQGLDFYCDYEATLEKCMGSLMASPCMNPEGFVKMYALEQEEANNYAVNFQVEAYSCQNIDTAKKYFTCETNINIQGIMDCSTTMEKDLEAATDACVPMDQFVTCVENYYVSACDEGIRSYICNTEEIALNFSMNGACAAKFHQC